MEKQVMDELDLQDGTESDIVDGHVDSGGHVVESIISRSADDRGVHDLKSHIWQKTERVENRGKGTDLHSTGPPQLYPLKL